MAERRTLAQLRTERARRGNSLNVEVAGEVPGALASWCRCDSALLPLHYRLSVCPLLAPEGPGGMIQAHGSNSTYSMERISTLQVWWLRWRSSRPTSKAWRAVTRMPRAMR